MKHSKKKSCSKKQDRLEPASLNVTQAAVHKGRMKKKKKKKSWSKHAGTKVESIIHRPSPIFSIANQKNFFFSWSFLQHVSDLTHLYLFLYRYQWKNCPKPPLEGFGKKPVQRVFDWVPFNTASACAQHPKAGQNTQQTSFGISPSSHVQLPTAMTQWEGTT